VGTGSFPILAPGSDKHREAIACRYASRLDVGAACGAFSLEHHARAAQAGVCCVTLAFQDVGQRQNNKASVQSDDDAPGGRP